MKRASARMRRKKKNKEKWREVNMKNNEMKKNEKGESTYTNMTTAEQKREKHK